MNISGCGSPRSHGSMVIRRSMRGLKREDLSGTDASNQPVRRVTGQQLYEQSYDPVNREQVKRQQEQQKKRERQQKKKEYQQAQKRWNLPKRQ